MNVVFTSQPPCRMFHKSSVKMGLDQAVLHGIENADGDKSTMTKEEMEKLLKNGAYDVFKDGDGENEINDFISQDIDSILERRATTIVYNNDGSKTGGGTFSKASFKSDDRGEAGVAVDDPDFWTK